MSRPIIINYSLS